MVLNQGSTGPKDLLVDESSALGGGLFMLSWIPFRGFLGMVIRCYPMICSRKACLFIALFRPGCASNCFQPRMRAASFRCQNWCVDLGGPQVQGFKESLLSPCRPCHAMDQGRGWWDSAATWTRLTSSSHKWHWKIFKNVKCTSRTLAF